MMNNAEKHIVNSFLNRVNEKLDNEIEKRFFPKKPPVCCGRTMYAAGGSLGEYAENGQMTRFWKCQFCQKEIEDQLQ